MLHPTRSYSLLLSLITAATTLLGVTGDAAATQGLRGDTTAALANIASGKQACEGLTATWTEGNGVDGWVSVEVRRSRVVVRHQGVGRADQWFSGRLDPEDCRDLAGFGADPSLRQLRTNRAYGHFGETRPRISVGIRDSAAVTAEQWSTEASNNAGFAAARRLLARLAQRVSDGEIAIALK